MEKLSVDLPGENLESVNHAVTDGDYDSPSAVIQEALKLWEEARRQKAIEELDRMIQKGIDSGSAPWEGAEALKKEFRLRRSSRESS